MLFQTKDLSFSDLLNLCYPSSERANLLWPGFFLRLGTLFSLLTRILVSRFIAL